MRSNFTEPGLAPTAEPTLPPAIKIAAIAELRRRLATRLWILAFDLEEHRSACARRRRYLRSAACCVGLAAIRTLYGERR